MVLVLLVYPVIAKRYNFLKLVQWDELIKVRRRTLYLRKMIGEFE